MDRDKILYADDDELMIKLARLYFSKDLPEYTTEFFEDGAELADRLEKDVGDVAVVVIDNEMPRKNGSEIIREYARRSGFEKIPFFF